MEDEYAVWVRRAQAGGQGRERREMGQQLLRAVDFSLVFSSLSHFLELVLWPLKLGAQFSQLTKVCPPGNERTFIIILSTFIICHCFHILWIKKLSTSIYRDRSVNWNIPESQQTGKILENSILNTI